MNQPTFEVDSDLAWMLVLPQDSEACSFLFSQFGGQPFLVRQMRLAANAGARQLLIVSDDDCDNRIEQLRDHHLSPAFHVLSRQQVIQKFCCSQTDSGSSADLVVQHASYAYEPYFLSAIVNRSARPNHNGKPIQACDPVGGVRLCSTTDLSADLIAALSTKELKDLKPDINCSWVLGLIRSEKTLRDAEHELWVRCRKDTDGFISTYLNRNLSLPISKRLAPTPITPNQVTIAALLIGFAGAVIIAKSGYWTTLGGAVLLKLGSIIDGVDGELARVRVQSSIVGEWLDTISDDFVSLAFVLTLAYRGWTNGSLLWIYLSLFTACCMIIVSAIYYKWLADAGRGNILIFDWFADRSKEENRDWRARVHSMGSRLFRRDLLITVVLVLALFGIIEASLFFIAPATLLILVAQLRDIWQKQSTS